MSRRVKLSMMANWISGCLRVNNDRFLSCVFNISILLGLFVSMSDGCFIKAIFQFGSGFERCVDLSCVCEIR